MPDLSGLHEDLRREHHVEGSSDRGFGLVFSVFFALFSAIAWWKDNPRWFWWFIAAAAVLAIALARPAMLSPLNKLWTMLGLLLFRIVSPLALAVIFYGMITPMGLLMRLRNKDILRRRFDPGAPTYWIPRDPPGPAPDSMKNQF